MRIVPSGTQLRTLRSASTLMLVLTVLLGSGVPASGQAPVLAPPPGPIVPGRGVDLGVEVTYAMPAAGRIRRGFTPPPSPFAAGHRGVDIDVPAGADVRAAAAGRVVFAGEVAGRRWVSIAHADGIVTTYGPLAGLEVQSGVGVLRGERLAAVATGDHGLGGRDHGLHWGARDGSGNPIDPVGLLGVEVARPSLVGPGRWAGSWHVVEPYDPWAGGRLGELFVAGSPEAVDAGFAVAPNPNHVVFLAGLASSSDTTVLDAEHLGYDPRSVTAFSYAGREEGRGSPGDPRRDQLPYGPADTWDGSEPAAARLAEQLRAQRAREPGRAVDLVGHSMGAVVIMRYLLEHHDPYDPTLPPIGNIVAIAAPFRGSDLAYVGRVLDEDILFDGFGERDAHRSHPGSDILPLSSRAIDELAVGSGELRELGRGFERALADGGAGPLAMGTRMLTIGGSRDLIVTPERARRPTSDLLGGRHGVSAQVDERLGIQHRVLPGGHDSVLGTEAVREVTWRFLAGEEVTRSAGHVPRLAGQELGADLSGAAFLVRIWALWKAPFGRLGRAGRAVP